MLQDLSLRSTHRSARGQFRLELETLEARVVPALYTVDTTAYPYSAVCAVEMTFPSGKTYIGSGALIDSNSLLTAGHVAYSAADGGYPTTMTVRAGYNNGVAVAVAHATAYYVDPRFVARENSGQPYNEDGDVAVISLDSPIGNTAGFFEVERAQAMFGNFAGMTLESSGYPGARQFDGDTQYYSTGSITGSTTAGSTSVLYWADTNPYTAGLFSLQYGGQSGSPVYRTVGNTRYIDAVFVASTSPPGATGYATLLSDQIYNEIVSWRSVNNTNPYEQVAFSVVHSNEYYTNFIVSAYQTYLGRSPDGPGLQNWQNQMQAGLTDEQLEASFIGSGEYIANHGGTNQAWVTSMYVDLLGRTPSAGEVNGWVNQLALGQSPYSVAFGFAASAEREGQRVTFNYNHYLHRPPESPAAVNGWVASFSAGMTNEDMIIGFVASNEYVSARANSTAWIQSVYLDVLGRSPSSAEVSGWLLLF